MARKPETTSTNSLAATWAATTRTPSDRRAGSSTSSSPRRSTRRSPWAGASRPRSGHGDVRGTEMTAAFEHPVMVRWRDTDALGHVNHVVFLTYLEEARDAFYAQVLGDRKSTR